MINFVTPVIWLCSFWVGEWSGNPQSKEGIKLYVLDGGTIDVSDMRSFSRDGRFAGERIQLVNPAFLIRHPKGDFLWDTGHVDALADQPEGTKYEEWHNRHNRRLIDQLQTLGLSPKDIEYLSLSHLHPDHSGNANLFSKSQFIVNAFEYAYMFSEAMKAVFGKSYGALQQAETLIFSNQHDVFRDGSVVIISMPGHTPGSSVLMVRLPKAGTLLLTGDLYIHARGRTLQTIPEFTHDDASLRSSRQKFEALAEKEKARVVIQHSKPDFNRLPKFPAFLD